MPKEAIYQPPSPGGEPSPFAEVQWLRDRFVSLNVMAGGDYSETTETRPGFAVDLDRPAINRLIRALRKARDQAFGSDA